MFWHQYKGYYGSLEAEVMSSRASTSRLGDALVWLFSRSFTDRGGQNVSIGGDASLEHLYFLGL